MIDLNKYLNRKYDYDKYNCANFVAEVWQDLTGENVSFIANAFTQDCLAVYRYELFKRKRSDTPIENSLVLIRTKHELHAGIFINNKILHLTRMGVLYQELSELPQNAKLAFYK